MISDGGDAVNVVQIGVIGIIATLLAIQMKSSRSEYGIYVCIGAGILVFTSVIDRLGIFIDTISSISSYISLDSGYLSVMLKMTGITYIAEFSSGICRDAGYQTLAGQIEIFAKLTILIMGLPVLSALLQTIQEFLS